MKIGERMCYPYILWAGWKCWYGEAAATKRIWSLEERTFQAQRMIAQDWKDTSWIVITSAVMLSIDGVFKSMSDFKEDLGDYHVTQCLQ